MTTLTTLVLLVALTSCVSRGPAQVVEAPTTPSFTLERPPPATGGDAQLRVTTWNVKKLGRETFRADDRLFDVLNETDVIAFQEVNARDTGREAMRILRDGMEAKTGRKLCYALSRPATDERVEVYGFIWRNDRLARAVAGGEVKVDCPRSADEIPLAKAVADRIVREPALSTFVFRPNARAFVLINAHLVPQESDATSPRQPENEVAPLFEVTDQSTLPTLVVGDFNLGPKKTKRRGDPFAVARARGFTASLVGVRTTLKRVARDYAKPFDNLWFRGFDLRGIGRVDVFSIFPDESPVEIIKTISDHAPVTGGYAFL